MRLVNLGLGEIADRLTILALKIAHGQQAAKDVAHFLTERNALLVQIRALTKDAGMEALLDLAAVNAMLWYAEDALRDHRGRADEGIPAADDLAAIGRIAFRIQALNDQRAELVRTLNKSAGTDYGPEKL